MAHELEGVWIALVRNPLTGKVTRDSVVILKINASGDLQSGSKRIVLPGGTDTVLTGTVKPVNNHFEVDIEDDVATFVGATLEDFDIGGGKKVKAMTAVKKLKPKFRKLQEEGTWVATKQG
jgi:hypothetical protein